MSNEELSAMTLPVRVRSLDSSVALFAVLLFCAIGGVFSLFYFEIDDNQPLLTLRLRPEDPQLHYPAHSGTDQTTPITKIPQEQDDPPPAHVKNHAAAVPEPHRRGILRDTGQMGSTLFASAPTVPGVFSLRAIPYLPIEPVMEVPEPSTIAMLLGAASLTLVWHRQRQRRRVG